MSKSNASPKVEREELCMSRVGILMLEDNPDGNGKRVIKVPLLPRTTKWLLREIHCYQKLRTHQHSNILSLLDSQLDPQAPALYLPFMVNGDLEKYLQKQGEKTSAAQRMTWASQVADAVRHLHSLQIYHTDLQPANLLLDAALDLQVADFEGASFDGEHVEVSASTQYSVKNYRDRGHLPPSDLEQADIYCLGGVLYTIETNRAPFESLQTETQFEKAYEKGSFPDTSGKALGNLIERIWRGEITNAEGIHIIITAKRSAYTTSR